MNAIVRPSGRNKFEEIVEHWRAKIIGGEVRPGDRMPSFEEMRNMHGLAQNTVNRVFRELEQEGLIDRRQGSGVFVARRELRPVQNVLGCVFPLGPLAGLPYFTQLLEGIQQVAGRERQRLMILPDAEPAGCEPVDGILFFAQKGRKWAPSLPAALPNVTLIAVNDPHPSVVADDYSGARQATEHLIALGHRRIAYLTDFSEGLPWTPQRLAGYRAALHDAGIVPEERWVRDLVNCGSWLRRGGLNMAHWLLADWRQLGCTALLVQNDLAAIGAIGSLQDAGILVPEEVSVIGFDGTPECEIARPNLTSVHVPLREIGAAGAELLLKMVRGAPAPVAPIVLPTRLDVRDSTAEADCR